MIVLIPVYNDWLAVSHLLRYLDAQLQECGLTANVLLADDGSTLPIPAELSAVRTMAVTRIDVLHMRRNLGHQRALAVGLCYIEAHLPHRAIVVMDGDGEDKPSDVPRLLQRFEELDGQKIVFAERTLRSENLTFRTFYKLYKAAHFLLTGERVRVGNFSVIPYTLLTRLVVVSDLWNHYAAAVFKSRLPSAMIPTQRGMRYSGKSTMNVVSLVVHGLSAMAVFGDRIGVRLIASTGVLALLTFVALVSTLVVRFATHLAIPGWATYTSGILLVMLLQMLMVTVVFVFMILGGRDGSTFLPLRDYTYFVGSLERLYTSNDVPQE